MKPILSIIVLYKMDLAHSPSYERLSGILTSRPDLDALIDCIVVDNSPAAQTIPPGFFGEYLHDGTNPGLAARYNLALARASQAGSAWLMLLDQDTTLTVAYIEEVARLAAEFQTKTSVVALVPKLMENGSLQSPHGPLFRDAMKGVDLSTHGLHPDLIRAYNSGAVLRISAVAAIGGFPVDYWLDYLDHAVFHRLQAAGGKVYVMNAHLEHEMSIHQPDKEKNPAYAARHSNQLAAEVRFYREHGSGQERTRHRKHLAAQGIRSVLRGSFRQANRYLRAAFLGYL